LLVWFLNFFLCAYEKYSATLNRAQRRARAKLRMKKNRRLAPHLQPRPVNPDAPEDNGNEGGDHERQVIEAEAMEVEQPNAPIERRSRKERQKEAKAQERQERLLYVQERKEQVQKLQRQKEEKQKKEQEEGIRREQYEYEQKRDSLKQEYCEWRYMFPSFYPSSSSGFHQYNDDKNSSSPEEEVENEGTVHQFLTELHTQQIINLGEMAKSYNVSRSAFKQRIHDFEKDGRIDYGIFLANEKKAPSQEQHKEENDDEEDNDYYVLVTPENMNSIKEYIIKKGCIGSVRELKDELVRILSLSLQQKQQ